MASVRVEPAGFTISLREGETLAEAAWRLGYGWPTICWGQAECMACAVQMVDGEEAAMPATDEELDAMADRLPRRPSAARLACRLRIRGEGVVVKKIGVKPPAE